MDLFPKGKEMWKQTEKAGTRGGGLRNKGQRCIELLKQESGGQIGISTRKITAIECPWM